MSLHCYPQRVMHWRLVLPLPCQTLMTYKLAIKIQIRKCRIRHGTTYKQNKVEIKKGERKFV